MPTNIFILMIFTAIAAFLAIRFYPTWDRFLDRLFDHWGLFLEKEQGGQPREQELVSPHDNRHVLVSFSEVGDDLTAGDLQTGILVTGQNGSGKSSGSGRLFLSAMLDAGYGGIVLCAKVDDAPDFIALAERSGRDADILRITAGGPHRFNPLDYEYRRKGGDGGGLSFSIARLLTAISEQQSKLKGANSDPFWTESNRILEESAITLCKIAYERVWLDEVDQLINSAPTSPEQLDDDEWKQNSFFARTILEIELENLDADTRQEADRALDYFLNQFPVLADNTRSSILATHQSVAGKFLGPPFKDLFFGESTFTPEDIFGGNKIVVLDLAARAWGEGGLLAQSLLKMAFQQAAERRDLQRFGTPFFFCVDECQNFLTEYDRTFLATSRSQKCIPLYMTQNLPSLIAAVGEEKSRSSALAIAGLFGIKVFHSNSCSKTNEWSADTIGKRYIHVDTSNLNSGGGVGLNETILDHYRVQPSEFSLLKAGGPKNDFRTEAILFQAGRTWSSGENYLPVSFEQILV